MTPTDTVITIVTNDPALARGLHNVLASPTRVGTPGTKIERYTKAVIARAAGRWYETLATADDPDALTDHFRSDRDWVGHVRPVFDPGVDWEQVASALPTQD